MNDRLDVTHLPISCTLKGNIYKYNHLTLDILRLCIHTKVCHILLRVSEWYS